MSLSVLFLLGSSYPADQRIEDSLRALIRPGFTGYQDILDQHAGGLHENRLSVRLEVLRRALAGRRHGSVVVIGRSSGAVVATRLACMGAHQIRGIVSLGYPFKHPDHPDEPDRTAHLPRLPVPMLIVQGKRDTYGTPEDARRYPLSAGTRLESLDADHGFWIAPPVWQKAASHINRFIADLSVTAAAEDCACTARTRATPGAPGLTA